MPHPGAVVRTLLTQDGTTPVPGCHDAFGAMLIAEAGYPVVYMSGFSVSASFGKPDVGILTMTQMVARAAEIAAATGLPVIADADTGYGGPANIAECVRAFEAAGVAAIHLEDQIMPKRCGAMPGKALVPPEEMALRLAAARKVRRSEDFLIIGRTDAMTLFGLDECVRRAKAMEAAGADAVMVPSLTTHEEFTAITRAVSVPVIHLPAETIRPLHSLKELEAAGVAMAIYALSLIQVSAAAQSRLLRELMETGTTAQAVPAMTPFASLNRLLGVEALTAFERSLTAET